jgi:cell division septation protein DedD
MPAAGEPAASWSAATTTPETEQPAAQPQTPHAATEPIPLPPVRVADAPANEPVAEPAPAASAEFGIDLGGASSMEALRIHWAALKANYGPLLVGLQPLAAQHPKRPSGIMYRLVVGPLPNAAEAARLCARFPALRTGCHPAKFSGEQLAAR